MTQMSGEIILAVYRAVITILTVLITGLLFPWIKDTVIPWMKEKRIYSIVCQFVRAAEKLAESGAIEKIDKKTFVLNQLHKKGIVITDEIDALIESAVEELDIAMSTLKPAVTDFVTYSFGVGDTEGDEEGEAIKNQEGHAGVEGTGDPE